MATIRIDCTIDNTLASSHKRCLSLADTAVRRPLEPPTAATTTSARSTSPSDSPTLQSSLSIEVTLTPNRTSTPASIEVTASTSLHDGKIDILHQLPGGPRLPKYEYQAGRLNHISRLLPLEMVPRTPVKQLCDPTEIRSWKHCGVTLPPPFARRGISSSANLPSTTTDWPILLSAGAYARLVIPPPTMRKYQNAQFPKEDMVVRGPLGSKERYSECGRHSKQWGFLASHTYI